MAMIKCRECGGEVAESAKVCPHCRAPDPNPASNFITLATGAAILGFIAYVIWQTYGPG